MYFKGFTVILQHKNDTWGFSLGIITCSDIFILCQKGNVSIVARPGMRIEIPDGVVLEDKVWLWDS